MTQWDWTYSSVNLNSILRIFNNVIVSFRMKSLLSVKKDTSYERKNWKKCIW